ncbi:MAG TPA: GtrA family protein [Flavisolibacter sp.]|nr:GtrA family protein [Flavisolibacter sp.]
MKKFFYSLTALLLSRKTLLTEAGKYFIVGGVCTVLDFALLFVLKEYFAVHFMTASVISFMAGTLLNYYLCTFWIFKIRRVTDRRLEMMFYILITGIGLGLNSIVIWVLTSSMGYHFMLSKLAATFVTYWWNFGARKYFLHRSVALQPGS